jgi:hypothetical protein
LAGNIILTAAYGHDVKPDNDPLVDLAEHGNHIMTMISRPDHYLVDAVPMLRHVPKWFPGAAFQRDAESYRKHMSAMRDAPYNQVKDQMVSQF